MMMTVSSRVLLALLLVVHTLAGWGAIASTAAIASGQKTILVDPCGDECCCGPLHCPCVYEVPVPGSERPAPAIPSQRAELDGARYAAPKPDPIALTLVTDDERIAHAWATLHSHPVGDLARRVMQLQCVWRN